MRFSLVTNLSNGAGLQRDYELLRGLLESYGHTVYGVQFNDYNQTLPQVDVMISLEVMEPKFFSTAKEHWFIPNSEWMMPWFKQFVPKFSRILCKTSNAVRIWEKLVHELMRIERLRTRNVLPVPYVQFLGWEALDLYDATITRYRTFLHLAGKSQTKNTAAVLEAFVKLPDQTLTFVSSREEVTRLGAKASPNVQCIGRIDEDDLRLYMNNHLFHIMPSQQEGFGMVLHEAVGCGAIVLTTDAPAMNEIAGVDHEMLIPVLRRDTLREDVANFVSPQEIVAAVQRALALEEETIKEIRSNARNRFIQDRDDFRDNFKFLMMTCA